MSEELLAKAGRAGLLAAERQMKLYPAARVSEHATEVHKDVARAVLDTLGIEWDVNAYGCQEALDAANREITRLNLERQKDCDALDAANARIDQYVKDNRDLWRVIHEKRDRIAALTDFAERLGKLLDEARRVLNEFLCDDGSWTARGTEDLVKRIEKERDAK